MKKLLSISLLCCINALVSVLTHAQDIFMGTIVEKNQNLYLKRCNFGADLYLIESSNPDIYQQIKQLQKEHSIFWLSFLASTQRDQDDILRLNVDEILDLHPDKSCHLNDELHDIFDLDTTNNSSSRPLENNHYHSLFATSSAISISK